MIAVVRGRPRLQTVTKRLEEIRTLAESCSRQLTGWAGSIEKLPFEGRRQMPETDRQRRETAEKARQFRLNFLRGLKPSHPLYDTDEARAARGEAEAGA
jgi:hypothetical protein